MYKKITTAALVAMFAFAGYLQADPVGNLTNKEATDFSHYFTGADIFDGTSFLNGWGTISTPAAGDTYTLNGSVLSFSATGTSQNSMLEGTASSNGTDTWNDINAGSVTVEISLRMNNIDNGLKAWYGVDSDRMVHDLGTNGVEVTKNGGGVETVSADLDDGEFHTLRFAYDGSSKPAHVWLDGVAITHENGGVKTTSSNDSRLLFGDSTSGTAGDDLNFDIAYIAYTDGAYSIPEPATLGMVVAFGGGILFIRRKLMM